MIPSKPSGSIWTDEQWLAINDSGHNIIVSAGAGSGKTAVLSERVIANLKKGMHINEMLLLTFTKAAASEMRERIRKKIKKDKDLVEELDKIDEAYITTFDSFALSIVKKYHYILNVSNNISIIDSSVIEMKKREILDSIFDKYYLNGDKRFLKLIGAFCVKDDKEIKNAINGINNKLDMLSNKSEYLESYMNIYYDKERINKEIDKYIKLIKHKFLEIEDELRNISSYVDNDYYEKINNSLYNLLNSDNYDDIVNNIEVKLPMLPRGSEDEVKNIKENINGILKNIKSLCCYENIDEIRDSINITYDYVEVMIDIIKEMDKAIYDYKFNLDVYEFNDIALMSIKVLRENKEVREELKYFFKEIMIDEYQDTNDLQETFISMIDNNNVYMVGDIKQSIYRFRNANPDIFKDKYDRYSLNDGGTKIDLNKNFRSRKEVLDNINLIFNVIMDNTIGGADYIKSHQMIFGNNSYIKKGTTEQNNDFEVYSYDYEKGCEFTKEEIECFIIANDIKNKIDSGYQVFDKEEEILRNITYKDFVILMDRTTNFDLYKRIFEYMGIPLAMLKDEKMNNDQDILVLKNLINFIIKVRDRKIDTEFKYLFISILRSFIYEYKDDVIFDYFISNNYKDSDLYKKAYNISRNIDGLSSYEIILKIIEEFNFYESIIKIGNIKSSMVKIDKILDSSITVASIGYDIREFSIYLNNMIDNDYEMKYSVNMGDNDAVKIMTIHKSKGLEYHVCYYSGLYKAFNILDLKERFLYDKNYGLVVPYFREGIGQTIYKDLVRENYINEEISEKIRLFYVALTRAKEKMIMVMPSGDNINGTKGMVSINERSKYRSFSDIINSIYGVIYKYYTHIDLDKINLSKDYSLVKMGNYKDSIPVSDKIISTEEIIIDNKYIDEQSFSKNTHKLINKEIDKNMKFGLYVHEILENIDLINPDYSNIEDEFVKNKIKNFVNNEILYNVRQAKIYHEYEFIYDKDNVCYHGIIDLMLEYDNHIDIIDYKLKDVSDTNYLKQLNGYRDYIMSISKKDVNIYLYSIIDGYIKSII